MRTRDEIEYKYAEMVVVKRRLKKFLDNPDTDDLKEIEITREIYNEQCRMCDLMRWVLNYK